MKNLKTTIIKQILILIGGRQYYHPDFHPIKLLKCLFFQKILRFNANVPWPVHWTSQIKAPHNIQKGTRNPGMSIGCYIDGRNGIHIGKNVWIGPRVSIISKNHDLCNYKKYISHNPIKIGDNCWLATNAIILPGVELGNHVIVAAGAVVTKSFPFNNIVIGGCPAKIIKYIEEYHG